MVGTTVSLVAGFKNAQVFTRAGDALQIFAQISASSRMWGSLCRDFCEPATAKAPVYRHIGWMTALRFSLRRRMPWETMGRPAAAEFRRRYHILEDTSSLNAELTALVPDEAPAILGNVRPPIALLDLQMSQVSGLLKDGKIPTPAYGEMLKVLRDLHDQQARCDRIKNNPYPRQYAIVSTMFVMIFVTLLPFGAAPIFVQLGAAGGLLGAISIWLTIPFSAAGLDVYVAGPVGEGTSNPFEGGANDVPISQICRDLEIELRTALGETDLPPPLLPVNGFAT
ncbi:hypothetical protein N8D56_09415 [Devosia sp. A8/3-2]|nr:hypothetical protein N8D56_09415 [Devosia sp. A8/3-2]